MRESEQSDWELTDEAIDGAVVWERLARCRGKLSNLQAKGTDRQGWSLKRKSLYSRLDLRRYDFSGAAALTSLAHEPCSSVMKMSLSCMAWKPHGRLRPDCAVPNNNLSKNHPLRW